MTFLDRRGTKSRGREGTIKSEIILLFRCVQRSFDVIGLGVAIVFLDVLALTAPIYIVNSCIGQRRDSARVATHFRAEIFFHGYPPRFRRNALFSLTSLLSYPSPEPRNESMKRVGVL